MVNFIKNLNSIIWGLPMIIILLGTHIFFTCRLKFVQKKIGKAIYLSVTPEKESSGALNSFQTLATTLAATLGTGNIIGVSTAVFFGGPGAVFWCWITGVLGMATTYGECYLSMLFRKKQKDGTYAGGPMYVLEYGLRKKGLAIFYALCTVIASFGVGCTTQSNSLSNAVSSLFSISPYITGFAVAILAGFVIIGGVKSIGKVCTRLVPAMGIFYMAGCFILLLINLNYLLPALICIIKSAFHPQAVLGGIFGTTAMASARYGIARGLFTNEAGLGSAAIAAAEANTTDPKRQSLVSMSATFWDTVVMCGITGLVIVSNLLHFPSSVLQASPGDLTLAAFGQIPIIGEVILNLSLIAFACATLLGWSYFGERAIFYLFGKRAIPCFQVGYLVMIFIGAVLSLDLVWELTDFINAFMAIPNLIALFALYRLIKS